MKFTLEIKCDNAAFTDDEGNHGYETCLELGSILKHVIEIIEQSPRPDSRPLFDSNGSRVGCFKTTGS